MFNLEQAIKNWRQQMLADGIKSPAVLDELESHLREDVERQARSGIDGAASFKAAVERIGQSTLLKAEFAKVAATKEFRWGKVVGVACCLMALPLSVWAIPSFLMIRELTMGERLLGSAAVIVTFLSIASWRFSHKFFPVIRNPRVRMGASISCGLAGLIWDGVFALLLFTVIVPHLFAGVGAAQSIELRPIFAMGVATLWAMALTAVLGGVAYGLDEAARRRFHNDSYA